MLARIAFLDETGYTHDDVPQLWVEIKESERHLHRQTARLVCFGKSHILLVDSCVFARGFPSPGLVLLAQNTAGVAKETDHVCLRSYCRVVRGCR